MTPVTFALARKHPQKVSDVMLVKTESACRIDALNAAFEEGIAIPVIALVESAAGMLALDRICAHPRVTRIAFGFADLSRDPGCVFIPHNSNPRCKVLRRRRSNSSGPPKFWPPARRARARSFFRARWSTGR